jgi:hypothetical protein
MQQLYFEEQPPWLLMLVWFIPNRRRRSVFKHQCIRATFFLLSLRTISIGVRQAWNKSVLSMWTTLALQGRRDTPSVVFQKSKPSLLAVRLLYITRYSQAALEQLSHTGGICGGSSSGMCSATMAWRVKIHAIAGPIKYCTTAISMTITHHGITTWHMLPLHLASFMPPN